MSQSAWGVEHGVEVSKGRKQWEKEAKQLYPHTTYEKEEKYMRRPFAFNSRAENRKRGGAIGMTAGATTGVVGGAFAGATRLRPGRGALLGAAAGGALGGGAGVLTGQFRGHKDSPNAGARRKQHNANLRNWTDQTRAEHVDYRRAQRDIARHDKYKVKYGL